MPPHLVLTDLLEYILCRDRTVHGGGSSGKKTKQINKEKTDIAETNQTEL